MTSSTNMDPVKSLLFQHKSNPSVKLASASRRQPSRKVSRTCSDDSIKSTTTEPTQAVKFVRFSKKIRTRKTMSRKDYTLEETDASFSSREDHQQTLRQCHKEVKKIGHGEKFKDKKYCARGLEGRTKIAYISKVQTRALAINAVLDEQLMQWNEGIVDEDAIAEACHIASSSCRLWASIVGRRDHKAAKEIDGSLYKKSSPVTNEALFMTGVGAGRVR
jgi:hypothetical protein